jgi:hypothetical protein
MSMNGVGVGAAAVAVGLVTAMLLGVRSQRAFNGFVTRTRPKYPDPPPGAPGPPDPAYPWD